MKIEKYDPEKHAEYFPNHHPPKYRDGDIEIFKSVAREALDELKEVVDLDEEEIELVIGVTDVDELGENPPVGYYFMGFSFSPVIHGYSRNAVFMRASNDPENWKAAFKSMPIH